MIIYTQVQTEFQLICGAESLEKIKQNWIKYLPKILGDGKVEAEITEVDHFRAIEAVDTALRPPGGAAKAPGAFTIYKV